MKKKILEIGKIFLLAVFLLIANKSFGQVAFGVKAGYRSSLGFSESWNFKGKDFNVKQDVANGFNVGLMLRAGGQLFGEAEVLYSWRKSNLDFGSESQTERYHYTAQSIDIPLMLGFSIVNRVNFKWRILAGPVFDINISNKTNLVHESISINKRPVSIGLDCGTGFDFWFVTLDFRYKLISNSAKYLVEKVEINKSPVNAFEVSIGFKFIDNMNALL